jgi:hypothetical protein
MPFVEHEETEEHVEDSLAPDGQGERYKLEERQNIQL